MDAALAALVAFIRKTHTSSVRWHGAAPLNGRLASLARAAAGRGAPPPGVDLVALTGDDEGAASAHMDALASVSFSFYRSAADVSAAAAAAATTSGGGAPTPPPLAPGRVDVAASPADVAAGTEYEAVSRLVVRHAVPPRARFALLARVRAARAAATLPDRRRAACRRLLAFYLLFQSSPSPDDVASFFADAPDFVADLAAALRAGGAVPVRVRTLALRALAVQLVDRGRHASVIAAASAGGGAGLLASLLRRSVAELASGAHAGAPSGGAAAAATASPPPSRRPGPPPTYSPGFVDALMSLCGALVGSTAGCAALSDAGLVPSLLPLLRHADPAHAPTVAAAVRVLEAFMDFSTAAAGLFRELGGLGAMTGRLRDEIAAARAAVASTPSPPRPRGTPPPPRPPVPHGRRLLLKALLRAVALASYAPSAGTRAQDDADAEALYTCLTHLFTSADAFGGGLFALAASVLADLVHHDPLRFPALDAAGAPAAFVAAVAAGVPPAAEALCAVPSALTALCLNAAGLDRVRDAGALRFFVDVCSHPGYLRALAGDTPSILGAGLDELVRHVPSLRPDGVEAATHLLARLARLGGVEAPPLAAPLVRVEEGEGGGGARAADAPPPPAATAAAQPMDGVEAVTPPTQQQRPAAPAAPPPPPRAPRPRRAGDAWPFPGDASPPPAPDAVHWLADSVGVAGRLLEAALASGETARAFAARRGADLLLAPYSAPRLPPTFGSGGGAHALLAALRALAAAATPPGAGAAAAGADVAAPLAAALASALADARAAAASLSPHASVPDLPPPTRDAYVRCLSRAEGLAAAAAAVARGSQPMLRALADPGPSGSSPPALELAALERIVAVQAAAAEDWRAAADAARAAERDKEREREEGGGESGGGAAGTPPPAPAATATPPSADPAEPLPPPPPGLPSRGRRKAGDELAAEVVCHFSATARSFAAALAKAVTAAGRRRDAGRHAAAPPAASPPPPPAAIAAAAALAAAARDALAAPPAPAPGVDASVSATRAARVRARAFEEVAGSLFDARRRAAHVLVLSFWAAAGGPRALAAAVGEAAAALDDAGTAARAAAAADPPPPPRAAGAPPDASTALTAAVAAVRAGLQLCYALASGPVLRASPGAAALAAVRVPGSPPSSPPPSLDTLETSLLRAAADAVLPLWAEAAAGRGLAQAAPSLVPGLASCVERCVDSDAAAVTAAARRADRVGTGAAAGPAPRGGSGGRRGGADASSVAAIVEMGFPAPRAEAALAAAAPGGGGVEAAMEWLFAQPDGGVGEGGDAAGGGGAADAAAAAPAPAPPSPDTAALDAALAPMLTDPSAPVVAADAEPATGEAAPSTSPPTPPTDAPTAAAAATAALAVARSAPDAAHALVDVLRAAAQRHHDLAAAARSSADGGDGRPARAGMPARAFDAVAAVVSPLVDAARALDARAAASSPTSDVPTAPLHLLVLLLADSQPARLVAGELGAGGAALDLVEAWVSAHAARFPTAGAPPTARAPAPPQWVEAALLLLDQLAGQAPAPPPTEEGKSGGDSARPAGQAPTDAPADAPTAAPSTTTTTTPTLHAGLHRPGRPPAPP